MRVTMPTSSCGVFHSGNMKRITGEGVRHHILKGGSILLGGVGSASSYSSPEDYIKTTGRIVRKGRGLEKLSKLADLSIIPQKKKSTIHFDI